MGEMKGRRRAGADNKQPRAGHLITERVLLHACNGLTGSPSSLSDCACTQWRGGALLVGAQANWLPRGPSDWDGVELGMWLGSERTCHKQLGSSASQTEVQVLMLSTQFVYFYTDRLMKHGLI